MTSGRPPYDIHSMGSSHEENYDNRRGSVSSHSFHPHLKRTHTASISVENTTLTEIITIYEKLKARQLDKVFRVPKFRPVTAIDVELKHIVEETLPIRPSFGFYDQFDPIMTDEGEGTEGGVGGLPFSNDNNNVLDFNKYENLDLKKYLYFSAETGLLIANTLEELSKNFNQLLSAKNYWFNIIDPSEKDLSILFSSFNVHDLTISDIRTGNTAEKIEIFKHYTFISMKLLCENTNSTAAMVTETAVMTDGTDSLKGAFRDQLQNSIDKDPSPPAEDVDFNILIFKDFVITIHDKQWASIRDILAFLNLLTSAANTLLTPDWVLFSVFIELAQDAQSMLDIIEPDIDNLRIDSKSFRKMGETMKRHFDMEFRIYKISRFLKPKMNILRMLKNKCGKRLSKVVIILLSDIFDDFREISHDLQHFNHILERSQDTLLALANVEESKQANRMGKTMKYLSEIALVFLPIQAIGGYMGMNVRVPFQTNDDEYTVVPFFVIVFVSITVAMFVFFLRNKTYVCKPKKGVKGFRRFTGFNRGSVQSDA